MEINLDKNELLSFDKNSKGLIVYCLEGQIWLTQTGDINDHLLSQGKSFTVKNKGKVVLFALDPSTLMLGSDSKANRIACKRMNLFDRITSAIFRHRWLWRRSIGQF